MPLGPRLDQPSAIGDEGRPRETSLSIAAALVVGVMLAVGFFQGRLFRFSGIALAVGLVAAGAALLGRDRVGTEAVGNLLFLPAAVVVVFALLPSVQSVPSALLQIGAVAALVGVTAGWNDVLNEATIRTTLINNGVAYLCGLGGVVFAGGLWLLWAGLHVGLVTLVETTDAGLALLGLCLLGSTATSALYITGKTLPVVEVAPVDRRDEWRRRYGHLARQLLGATVAGWVVTCALWVGLVLRVVQPILAVEPLSTTVLWLTAWPVVVVLAGTTGLAVVVAIGVVGTSYVTAEFDSVTTRNVGAAIAGVGYVTIVVVMVSANSMESGLVVLASSAVPLVVYAVLTGLLVLVRVGVLSDRAGPAALTAVGLVCVAIGSALSGLPAAVVFGAVASALVVWDVTTFGLGVTVELGHRPDTRRLELYHGVFAVSIGLIGIAILTVLDTLRRSVATGVGTPEAMVLAALGVVLLVGTLRG